MRYFRGLAAFTTHRAVPVGVAVATTIGLGVVALTVTASPALAETSVTFGYTGSEQTFTVPDGVTSLHIVAIGAPGGTGGSRAGFTANGGPGGNGGTVTADIPVTPGSTLYVEVGGPGADGVSWGPFNPMFESGYRPLGGFNGGGGASWGNDAGSGGGGGGASDVRTCLRAPGQPTWGNHLPICATALTRGWLSQPAAAAEAAATQITLAPPPAARAARAMARTAPTVHTWRHPVAPLPLHMVVVARSPLVASAATCLGCLANRDRSVRAASVTAAARPRAAAAAEAAATMAAVLADRPSPPAAAAAAEAPTSSHQLPRSPRPGWRQPTSHR